MTIIGMENYVPYKIRVKGRASKSKKEFDFLYTKYERTSFFAEGISIEEVVEAHNAIKKGKDKSPVGKFNRPAKVVLLLHLKINIILSRIPIFTPIVEQNLAYTSQIIHRDIYLMNGMITISRMLNDYYLTLAKGDIENQKKILAELIKKCRENITYLQENQPLNKDFEVDPLIKLAIVVLEILKYPFHPQFKMSNLTQARIGLFKIINLSHNQNAIRQANRYISDIEEYIKDQEDNTKKNS